MGQELSLPPEAVLFAVVVTVLLLQSDSPSDLVVVGLVALPFVVHVYLAYFAVRGSTVGYLIFLAAVLLDARSGGVKRGGSGSDQVPDAATA